ncbi:MAG TPA: TIR domain-containing protein [Acidobacteriaceae bacterium]|nr:TIR domain-containing protein [Acidobacteriaceae bacterium]
MSFYYKLDNWRVSQVKNIGAIDEQPILSANRWEEIKKKGEDAIKDWIESNMKGRECLIVLVGSQTSGRRWVKYEIRRACERGIGVMGVYVHNLKDADGRQAVKGSNPFDGITVGGKSITGYAKMYDPPYTKSTEVYDYIGTNMENWIETAIRLRS